MDLVLLFLLHFYVKEGEKKLSQSGHGFKKKKSSFKKKTRHFSKIRLQQSKSPQPLLQNIIE